MNNSELRAEDYLEPRCILCEKPYTIDSNPINIPQGRILEKLDYYISQKEFASAEKHLEYWKQEAELGNDRAGLMLVLNEMMGLYRKTGNKEKAMTSVNEALELNGCVYSKNTFSFATTLLNAATAMLAFGNTARAIELYEQAKPIYMNVLGPDDSRLADLYNNLAVALGEAGRYGEAYQCFRNAVSILKDTPEDEANKAITYLNMANAVEAEHGLVKAEKKIDQYLEFAEEILDRINDGNSSYYAFVCEKCAPVFEYYGWFLTAANLKERTKKYYERP